MSFEIDRDSAARTENVHPLAGDHPQSLAHTLDTAAQSLDVGDIDDAIAALNRARKMAREAEAQTGREPEIPDKVIADRVRRVFDKDCSMLADYLLRGQGWEDCAAAALDDAWAIGEVLSVLDVKSDELADQAVPALAFLQTRILDQARAVRSAEFDRQEEEREAMREAEERQREAQRNSPASRVDVIGFMTGLNERSQTAVQRDIETLEAQDAKAAEIVRAKLDVGRNSVLFVSDGPHASQVRLIDHHGDEADSWSVSHETAQALKPLAAGGDRHE